MNERLLLIALLLVSGAAGAKMTVDIHKVSAEGVGDKIGTVSIEKAEHGSLLTPELTGLPPGAHGFHLHTKPSCEPGEDNGEKKAALAAGGHFDPNDTGSHQGPYGQGHLGDLPVLYVTAEGEARDPVLAPRVKPEDFPGHALVIHAGGDNYSDKPEKLGGGGARIACGVVKATE